ncbi:MAG: hypothetical protein KGS61_01710 [Verrucomicrobia bacterium]|nr:hypothetical protein [Verrucomicrobiota bacterium]
MVWTVGRRPGAIPGATVFQLARTGNGGKVRQFNLDPPRVMRRISSRLTFISKRVFPVFWFGFLAFFNIETLRQMIAKNGARRR